MAIRNFLYDFGIIKSYYFADTKVIVVGNLAVGGTGKTPVIEFITRNLKDKHKIAVLSRGYKRSSKGFIYVDPDMNASVSGDEPLEIKRQFPDVVVAVCKKRVEGIKKLQKDHKPDIILLDDAFQHRKVKPSKAVLLTEYHHPFYEDRFLPVGRLRDNKKEAHRADIVVVTKSPPKIFPVENTAWRGNLHLLAYQKLFFSFLKYPALKCFSQTENELVHEKLKNYEIILVSGIARPHYLYDFLRNFSNKIIHLKFPDHKNYSETDIQNILDKFTSLPAEKKIIVTTSKDAVKINPLLNDEQKRFFYSQEIEIDFHFNKAQEFIEELLL